MLLTYTKTSIRVIYTNKILSTKENRGIVMKSLELAQKVIGKNVNLKVGSLNKAENKAESKAENKTGCKKARKKVTEITPHWLSANLPPELQRSRKNSQAHFLFADAEQMAVLSLEQKAKFNKFKTSITKSVKSLTELNEIFIESALRFTLQKLEAGNVDLEESVEEENVSQKESKGRERQARNEQNEQGDIFSKEHQELLLQSDFLSRLRVLNGLNKTAAVKRCKGEESVLTELKQLTQKPSMITQIIAQKQKTKNSEKVTLAEKQIASIELKLNAEECLKAKKIVKNLKLQTATASARIEEIKQDFLFILQDKLTEKDITEIDLLVEELKSYWIFVEKHTALSKSLVCEKPLLLSELTTPRTEKMFKAEFLNYVKTVSAAFEGKLLLCLKSLLEDKAKTKVD